MPDKTRQPLTLTQMRGLREERLVIAHQLVLSFLDRRG